MKEPTIIFEDDHVLVIDKPAGWIVNRADTARYQKTIQEWVEKKIPISKEHLTSESEFVKRGGIVHRLDKETSGLLIIAKSEIAFTELQKQFKEGKVSKTYRALLHGKLKPEEGEINVPIGRLPWNRTRFGILPAGRESRTLYKVIGYYVMKEGNRKEEMTFVEAYPKTGRTHQLRVHFQYLHHPLFGDSLYAGRKNVKRDRKILDRHFLHAVTLKFTHPVTGAPLELHSPLPEGLEKVISQLEK